MKQKRGREGQRKKREKKEVKKQGQYTQRNVVLQTVELAKIKMHCHYGNTRRKRREKRLTMKYRKKAETICTFKLHAVFVLIT